VATAGLLADGKHLAQRGREEANNFRDQYGAPVPLNASHAFFIHLSALVCLNGPGL
jgi:20S proteasome alpha/beta subunit